MLPIEHNVHCCFVITLVQVCGGSQHPTNQPNNQTTKHTTYNIQDTRDAQLFFSTGKPVATDTDQNSLKRPGKPVSTGEFVAMVTSEHQECSGKSKIPEDSGDSKPKKTNLGTSFQYFTRLFSIDMQVFEALKWSETFTDEITAMGVTKVLGERGPDISTVVYNRIIHHLEGPPLTKHQGVADENGLEVRRLLNERYGPVSPFEGNPTDVEGHEPRQDLEGQGPPGVYHQVGGLHEHARMRLHRTHLEPNAHWDIGPHDAR